MEVDSSRASFTLIELLITIGIVTILSVVVVLTLNPAQLLRQARDSVRLADIDNLHKAIALHQVDVSGGTYGAASTTYVSIPDTSSTCANLGLPALPSGWTYRCATSANYKKVDGTGWVPVNFTSISSGSPFGALPTDPVNTTSTGNYYTYAAGSSWALTSLLESDKYLKQSALNDGGYDPGRYERGDVLSLVAQSQGLVGWWRLDESSGTLVDSSGNGNSGAQSGGAIYGVAGKVGTAVSFDGVDDQIDVGSAVFDPTGTNKWSVHMWIKPDALNNRGFFGRYDGGPANGVALFVDNSSRVFVYRSAAGTTISAHSTITIDTGTWRHVVVTYDGASLRFYLEGVQREVNAAGQSISAITDTAKIGYSNNGGFGRFQGSIDDVRIYSRALSAAEIQAIYNATK